MFLAPNPSSKIILEVAEIISAIAILSLEIAETGSAIAFSALSIAQIGSANTFFILEVADSILELSGLVSVNAGFGSATADLRPDKAGPVCVILPLLITRWMALEFQPEFTLHHARDGLCRRPPSRQPSLTAKP
jgi:hypothetical protein